MGSVNITLANNQLGATLQTNDGIAGLVLTGQDDSGGYHLGTPILVTSLANLAVQGITEASNAFAHRQVKEFYDEAGQGAQLYLMLVPATQKVSDIADHTNADGALKLLTFAQGKVKLLGIMSDDTAVASATSVPTVVLNSLNEEVYTAITKMNVLAASFFGDQKPFRALIGATSYNDSSAGLSNLTAGTTNSRTAVVLGDTQTGLSSALGLVLGRLSAIPVMRKVSRVRTGAMSNSAAYIGSNRVETIASELSVISEKGFITWWIYPNVSGYFLSGDDTCSSFSDDYHSLAHGRVIDKAHLLAYSTFVQEVDDEVPVKADGTLDSGFCKWLSQQILNQVNNTMTANNEISSASCFIDPVQNILSTNRLNVVLRIVPVGYATDIEINLGFGS